MKVLRSGARAALAVLFCASALAPQSATLAEIDRRAMRAVAVLLDDGHLTDQKLDDSISRRALDAYLDGLDPLHYYFEQSDLRAFERARTELDDMLRRGDASFATSAFARYLQRVDERVATIVELLDEPQDFSVDEWLETDPDALAFPTDAAEARERWRKRIKYELLEMRADGVGDQDARERLRRRYEGFQRRVHQLEEDEIVEMFVTAVTSSFDPHSSYMGAHTLENFEIQMRLDYHGVGALLGERDGDIVIERILPGGPAEEHGGLKAGDAILAVGQGEDDPLQSSTGMRLRDVVQMIRGPAGTVVRISVAPKAGGPTHLHRLVRGRTELVDREAKGEVREQAVEGGEPLQVGLIDLPSFYGGGGAGADEAAPSATRDLRRILTGFADQGVDVVVLDLRGNGGGYLTEAVEVAGLFLDQGPVVQVKNIDGRTDVLSDTDAGFAWQGPLVVLTSKLSASASEIVAGAIKDYRRGLVVGDQSSHGKGTVQRVMPLDPPGKRAQLGALKMTVQKFYRVNGDSTQLRGVEADLTLPSFTGVAGLGESELDNALPFDAIDPVPHDGADAADPRIVAKLRDHSRARREGSDEFAALARRIAAYAEMRERHRVPLQEEKFKAMRAAIDAAEPEVDPDASDEPDAAASEQAARERDRVYVDEVVAIAADYAALLRGADLADRQPRPRKPG